MTENPDKNSGFAVHEIFDPFFLEILREHWLSEHFTLGTDTIDAQHLWICALTIKMETLLKGEATGQRNAKLDAYTHELLRFLSAHFELEGRVINASGLAQAQDILREHADFLSKLQLSISHTSDNTSPNFSGLVQVVKLWISRHIKVEDTRWKLHLINKHTNPNDFVRATIKDVITEDESPHAQLYKQLVVQHEVIPGIHKATLDDLFLLWKRFDVRTNLPLIDMQHLWLFKLVVEVEGMLHISFEERRSHLERILTQLLAYVNAHFFTEEILMEGLGYAESKNHRKLHDNFKGNITRLKAEYDLGNHHSLSSLVTVLRQWLLTHIVIEDNKFARFCEINPTRSLNASRILIKENNIPITHDQTLLYMYISARLKAG